MREHDRTLIRAISEDRPIKAKKRQAFPSPPPRPRYAERPLDPASMDLPRLLIPSLLMMRSYAVPLLSSLATENHTFASTLHLRTHLQYSSESGAVGSSAAPLYPRTPGGLAIFKAISRMPSSGRTDKRTVSDPSWSYLLTSALSSVQCGRCGVFPMRVYNEVVKEAAAMSAATTVIRVQQLDHAPTSFLKQP